MSGGRVWADESRRQLAAGRIRVARGLELVDCGPCCSPYSLYCRPSKNRLRSRARRPAATAHCAANQAVLFFLSPMGRSRSSAVDANITMPMTNLRPHGLSEPSPTGTRVMSIRSTCPHWRGVEAIPLDCQADPHVEDGLVTIDRTVFLRVVVSSPVVERLRIDGCVTTVDRASLPRAHGLADDRSRH